jgi:error-prone DNA polymerase
MKLAIVAAGFTPGEADQLRRAMAAWRRPGVIEQFRTKLFEGMLQRGLARDFAELVYQQIQGFGSYGFPESHAASFALLVYVSSWLKCHYQEVFTAALLNSQPMGFYSPSSLVRDAREHGVPVLPVCVNHSQWDCTLEPTLEKRAQRSSRPYLALRLGFRMLKGFAERHAQQLLDARQSGAFPSMASFAQRTRLSQAVIAKLAEADAFASLAPDRRHALWEALAQDNKPKGGLFATQHIEEPLPTLPPISLNDQVLADYQTAGLSLKAHPISFYRRQLSEMRVLPASALSTAPVNRQVRVAGLIILRQRPSTAKGITFVSMEDETGVVNLVVRQAVWEHHYTVARSSSAWLAHGKLERRGPVIHVVVNRIEDLTQVIGQWGVGSRDFR